MDVVRFSPLRTPDVKHSRKRKKQKKEQEPVLQVEPDKIYTPEFHDIGRMKSPKSKHKKSKSANSTFDDEIERQSDESRRRTRHCDSRQNAPSTSTPCIIGAAVSQEINLDIYVPSSNLSSPEHSGSGINESFKMLRQKTPTKIDESKDSDRFSDIVPFISPVPNVSQIPCQSGGVKRKASSEHSLSGESALVTSPQKSPCLVDSESDCNSDGESSTPSPEYAKKHSVLFDVSSKSTPHRTNSPKKSPDVESGNQSILSKFRCGIPDGFQRMDTHPEKADWCFEDVIKNKVDIVLLSAPAGFDWSCLEGKKMDLKGQQVVKTEKNGTQWKAETREVSKNQLNNYVPLVPSKSGELKPAGQFSYHVTFSEDIDLPPLVLPSVPDETNFDVPEGLKCRYVPFGSGRVSRNEDKRRHQDLEISGESPPSEKRHHHSKSKKKKKNH